MLVIKENPISDIFNSWNAFFVYCIYVSLPLNKGIDLGLDYSTLKIIYSRLFPVRGEWLFAMIVLVLFGSSIFCMCLCCRRVYEADTREPYPLFYDGQRELFPVYDQRRQPVGQERRFRQFR